MNVFKRRALLLVLLVVCLFGLTILGASAATYDTDANAVTAGAVARIGNEGGDGYYATIAEAITAAQDGDTIYILADASVGTIGALDKAITITSVNGAVPTFNKQITIANGGDLTLSSLTFKWVGNPEILLKGGGTVTVIGTKEAPTTGTGDSADAFVEAQPEVDTTATVNLLGYVNLSTNGNNKFVRTRAATSFGNVVLNVLGDEGTKSAVIAAGNTFDIQGAATSTHTYTIKNACIDNSSNLHLYTPQNTAADAVQLTYGNVEILGSKLFGSALTFTNTTVTFLDDAAAARFKYPVRLGTTASGKVGEVYFADVASAEAVAAEGDTITFLTDAAALAAGYPVRLGDVATGEAGKVYFADLPSAIAAVQDGGTANIYLNAPVSHSSMLPITNKHITLIGSGNVLKDNTYDLTYAGTKNYAFQILSAGSLIFQDITVNSVSRPLIQYAGATVAVGAQADRDIVIEFNSAYVVVTGSQLFISSGGHHNSVAEKKCDSVTVTIDENSTIKYTATSANTYKADGSLDTATEIYFIAFNHNTHGTVTANIHGNVEFTSKGANIANIWLIRSNNPSTTHITVSETANIKVDIQSNVTGTAAFACSTTTKTANGKLNIHADAITDENGLTLDGMHLFSSNGVATAYDVTLTAANDDHVAAIGAMTKSISGTVSPVFEACLSTADGCVYYETFAEAFAATKAGSANTLYLFKSIELTAPLEIYNKDITIIGQNVDGAYDLDFKGAADSVAFIIYMKGSLTFKDMNIQTKAQLVSYNANKTLDIAQADKDVNISFVNTDVTATISSRYASDVGYSGALIASSNHYTKDGGCGEQGDTVTVRIDANSTIDFTCSYSNAFFLSYNHNSHPYCYTYIDGDVTVNVTSTANGETTFVRSNNPSTTQIHISKDASIKVTMSEVRQTNGKAFFATVNGSVNNQLYVHADAITDENGKLTLDNGMMLYSGYTASATFDARIIADDTSLDAVIGAMQCSELAKDAAAKYITNIAFRFQVGNEYHYAPRLDLILSKNTTLTAVTVVHDTAVKAPVTISGRTLTIEGLNSDVTITKVGEINADGTYNKVETYMFEVGSNSDITFKNITVKSVRIIKIIADVSGAKVDITLDGSTTFEGLPNVSAYTADYNALIYKESSNVDVTINVNKDATMIIPATETANNPLIYLKNAAKGTVNVYGTMKNLATVAESANAQVFIAKQSCNAFLNVYDGAVIEGTSDNVANKGNWSGIVYYSAATENGINIYGGTITIHGRTGLAYTGTKATINISGGTINNTEAEYAMFFGSNQTANVSGSPAINSNGQKLLATGTLNVADTTNFANDATAVALGYPVRLGDTVGGNPNKVYFTALTGAAAAIESEGTVYVLADISTDRIGKDTPNYYTKKLHITSANGGPHTVSHGSSTSSIAFYLGGGAELTFTNVIYNLKGRLARIDGDCKIIFGNGATFNSNSNIFIYSNFNADLDTTYTIDFQEGSTINAKTAFTKALVYYEHNDAKAAANVTLSFAGTITLTGNSPLFKDVTNQVTTAVEYIDVSKITCNATNWFADKDNKTEKILYIVENATSTKLFAKGFKTTAEAAEWGYKYTNASAMTYTANPDSEWNYMFLYHTSLTQSQYSTLDSYGGEMWQLRSVTNVWASQYYYDLGTITFKGYNKGVTITSKGSTRFRVQNTTVILDNITIKITQNGSFGIHGGSAEKPSVLKLVNGAVIQSDISAATQLIYFMNEHGAKYGEVHVDKSSSLVHTGSVTSGDVNLIYVRPEWDYVTLNIKGTVKTSVANTAGAVHLIKLDNPKTHNTIVVDGGTLANTGSYKTLASLVFAATATTDLSVELKNNPTLTFTTQGTVKAAQPFVIYGMMELVGVSGAAADAQAASVGVGARYNGLYSTLVETCIKRIGFGGTGTVNLVCTAYITDQIEMCNRNVTLVGQNNPNYDLYFTITGYYGFQIWNIGTLTFQNVNIAGARPLVQYCGRDTETVENVADRDIVINFINTKVDIEGSSVFIGSEAHHGDVATKKCDSVTVNIDKDSVINYTATSSGNSTNIYFISFNHNTHPNVTANINGKVNFTSKGATIDTLYVVRSNNPKQTVINVSETARIKVDVQSNVLTGAYFTSCTGGTAETNKLYIHENAIVEDGKLTLGGINLYTAYTVSCTFDARIIAASTKNEALFKSIPAVNSNAISYVDTEPKLIDNPLAFRVEKDGQIYYFTRLDLAIAFAADGDTITVIQDNILTYVVILNNKAITIEGLTGEEKLSLFPTYGYAKNGSTYELTVSYMGHAFEMQNGASLTFNKLLMEMDFLLRFTAGTADTTMTLTFGDGAHLSTVDFARGGRPLIYSGLSTGNVVINVKEGASITATSTAPVAPEYALVAIHKGLSTTLNVWGTMKNLVQLQDGKSAQVFAAKGGSNNATLNVYEGAVLEGTSSSVTYTGTHGGSYCGIIYYSEATNVINIYGGTITVHGVTGVAYTGHKCTINISGKPVIYNVDAEYPLFYGGDQTANVDGTITIDANNQKLLNSGTINVADTTYITNDTTAVTLHRPVRLGDTVGGYANTVYYAALRDAVKAAPNGATVYVLSDITTAGFGNRTAGKAVIITSANGGPHTVTAGTGSAAGSVLFELYDGADITFTNVHFSTTYRFARSQTGTSKLTFGPGSVITTNNSIFIYGNSATDSGNTSITVDFQYGSTVTATAKTGNGLIYHNQAKDWDGDGEEEDRVMNATIYIAGTINTVNSPVAMDHNGNGAYVIHYDARTAEVNTGTAPLMGIGCKKGILYYEHGTFETTEAGAAWGYDSGAYTMIYSADTSRDWQYAYTYDNQFLPLVTESLNANGGEVWQLRNNSTIYSTRTFNNLGTVTIKSYNGARINLQSDATQRLRLSGTTLILDGIEIRSAGSAIGIHGGSAENPTILKLINGAKIVNTAKAGNPAVWFMDYHKSYSAYAGSNYSHLYVDETSSITQSGTVASDHSYVICAGDQWANGSITIKGTVSTSAVAEVGNSYLICIFSPNASNQIVLDGAKLSHTGAASGWASLLHASKLAGEINVEIKNNCTFDYAPTSKNAACRAFVVNGVMNLIGLEGNAADEMAINLGVAFRYNGQYSSTPTALYNRIPTDGEGTIYVITDATFGSTCALSGKKATIEGLTGNETITASARGFELSNGANVTFKNIHIQMNRFLSFSGGKTGVTMTLTLAEGAHVTTVDYAADPNAVVYSGQSKGHIVINILEGASLINVSSAPVAPEYALIAIHNGETTTLNVWGTLRNLVQLEEGKSAQVFAAKGLHNDATLNIYEGAVIEGTSSKGTYTGTHGGSYAGIIYYSQGDYNKINVYGGEITVHGRTGLAYLGINATVNFLGEAVINNPDAEYAMFFGGNYTVNVRSLVKFNTPKLLCNNTAKGTLYVYSNRYDIETLRSIGANVYSETAKIYTNSLADAISWISEGRSGNIYLLGNVSVGSEVEILNRNVTLIGMDYDGEYHLKSSAAFAIYSKGSITFQDLRISATAKLVDYNANKKVPGEQADKDVVINFINTYVYAKGSIGSLIGSRNHYAVKNGGCGEQANEVTLNIDKDSTIDFTSSSTDNVFFISFNHNSHKYVYANIDGQINLNVTGKTTKEEFYFVRSNNPSTTQITVSETAKINITLPQSRLDSGLSYFTSCTGGSASSNKLTMHLDAISDENGLTLGGVRLYAGYTASCIFEVDIIAKDTSMQDALLAWVATAPSTNVHNPIAFLAEDNGTFHYTNTPTAAFANVGDGGTVYVMQNVSVSGATLHNKTATLKGFTDGIVITNTSTSPFITLTGNATLNIENLKLVGNRIVCFKNGADTRATLNLNDGAYVEGGDPNQGASSDDAQYQVIYCDSISGHVVVNIGANATVIRPDTYTLDGVDVTTSRILNFKSAASVTVNVYGTLLNKTKLPLNSADGKSTTCNAQIYYSAGTNTKADFNVFEGAVIEGAAWNTQHNGSYSGLFYFSVQGNITIEGGTITSYGPNPLNFIGYNSTNQIGGGFVKISGNTTINMPDLDYGMLYMAQPGAMVTIDGENIVLNINNKPLYHAKTTPFISANGTFTSDEAAAAVGLGVRLNTNFYTNYLTAENIKDASTLLLLNNPNKGLTNVVYILEGLVIDGKSLTITSAKIGEGGVHLKNSPLTTVARLFTLKNGATLTIDGVALTNTASTVDRQVDTVGTIIAIDESATVDANGKIVLPAKITVNLTNVTVTASNSIPFYFGGDSVIDLNIVGGSFTGVGMFAVGYYAGESATGAGDSVDIKSNVKLNVTVTGTEEQHVVFKTTKSGDSNSLIFTNSAADPYKPATTPAVLSNKDDIRFTLTHVDFNAAGHGIYLRGSSALTLDYSCGELKSAGQLFSSQAGSAWYANFTDVDFISTRTAYTTRPYGSAGSNSYMNFNGGSFTANKVKSSSYILSFNNDIAVTFNGTVFNSTTKAPLFGYEAMGDVSITAIDCEFNVAGKILHPTKATPLACNGIYVADDATALTLGLYFRATVNGETRYFTSIGGAVLYADNGSVIYILGNSVEAGSDIKLDKFLMFESVGAAEGEKYTITHTGAGNLFSITTGLQSAPVRFVMDNIKFISTTATGSLFSVGGNAYAEIVLTDCELDTKSGGVVTTLGNGVANVDLNGGDFKSSHPFQITETSAIKLNAYNNVTLISTGSGNAGTMFYISNNRGEDGATVINLTDVEMYNTTGSGHGIYAMGVSKVDLNMENVTLKVKGWALSSQSNTHWRVNMKNVDITSTGNTATRLYGASGSYINIEGGKFSSGAKATSFTSSNGYAVANFGNSITVNFYDGLIESDVAPCISGLTATVTINIYGGTFNYNGTTDGVSPIAIPGKCNLNVYGGTFRSNSRTAPVFSNVAAAANTLTLNAYHAYGNANLITNLGAGTASANHTGYGQSSLNTIVTTRGATPVLLDGAAGLGFRATLDAATYNHLKSLASEQELRYGMLIIPTDKLPENVAFTHYGLAHTDLTLGKDYFDVEAGEADIQLLEDGSVVITIAYTDIEDYNTAYSVIFYANMDYDFFVGFDAAGSPIYQKHNLYQYSAYDKSENSRSLAQVARATYNDNSATQDEYYTNAIEGGLFSHYTAEQRGMLATLCDGDTAQKELDIFIMAGGSNAAGSTIYGGNFADNFDYSSISSNVFYSGLITDQVAQTYGGQILNFTATKYTAIGSAPALGLGWNDGTMGVELGMAQNLSKYYNDTTGKYAAIIKYAVNDSNLVGADADEADWGDELYSELIKLVAEQISDYEALGYKVNVVGMYWMQGEEDVAHADKYADALTALISNVRAQLSTITGTDLSAMPVVIGEIANFLGLTTSQQHSDFVAVQNSLLPKYNAEGELIAGVAGVVIDSTSKYVADSNGIFITPAELNATGERVIAAMLANGTTSLDDEIVDEIVIPKIENTTEILMPDGTPWLDTNGEPIGFTSLVMAAAKAPAGSTIKLTADQTIFTQMTLLNLNGITLDGNGATITVNSNETGLNLQNANVTLKNFKLVHNGTGVAIKVDATSSLVIEGDTYIEATGTAIELAGTDAKLEIKGGTFKTTDANAENAIIRTSGANIEVTGGVFEAAEGSSCIHIDKNAPAKLTVNVTGGSFKTTDKEIPATTSDGMVIPGETIIIQVPAFVNESPVAILVVDPSVEVDASILMSNAGIGAHPNH